MIAGCLEWQREGLRPPEGVQEATDGYFRDQDAVGRWLAERCVLAPSLSATKASLFESWTKWAHATESMNSRSGGSWRIWSADG